MPEFRPGFRLSIIDALVIFVGVISSLYFWSRTWWISFIIAFVVGHFFLFCNVFRIARPLELIWASVFCVFTLCTLAYNVPTWPITVTISLIVTAVVIVIEMKKPSYHGVGWRWINPKLREWWNASMVQRSL